MKTNYWLKIIGLFLTLLYVTDIGSAQTNDSIVSLEADIAELSLLPASDVPSTGTFWLVTGSNGLTAPFPCAPPGIGGDNTYTMPNGAFLVDGTTGESGVSSDQLVAQMNAVSNLIVNAQAQATATASRTMEVRAMDDSGPPFPGGGSGTNDGNGGIIGYAPPDYGTNLYIAQTSISNEYLMGIGSNTIAGVNYVIQSVTNLALAQNAWQYEGMIVGSYVTNWTPLSVPQYNRQNLFIRLASQQSSDGSSIPDSWEAEYGLTNVDPNAQDAAGDGRTIYQKYVLGENPNTFYTPAGAHLSFLQGSVSCGA